MHRQNGEVRGQWTWMAAGAAAAVCCPVKPNKRANRSLIGRQFLEGAPSHFPPPQHSPFSSSSIPSRRMLSQLHVVFDLTPGGARTWKLGVSNTSHLFKPGNMLGSNKNAETWKISDACQTRLADCLQLFVATIACFALSS